jgi:hypothetical protein
MQWLKSLVWKQFKYSVPIPKDSTTPKETPENTILATAIEPDLGAFVTSSVFAQASDYKLYNCWTLDPASDIHVCNNSRRSQFKEQRKAGPTDWIITGKDRYRIEAFGTVILNVDTPKGEQTMTLLNVPGFMTNLVSLSILNSKDVHWNSRFPDRLERNGNTFLRHHE